MLIFSPTPQAGVAVPGFASALLASVPAQVSAYETSRGRNVGTAAAGGLGGWLVGWRSADLDDRVGAGSGAGLVGGICRGTVGGFASDIANNTARAGNTHAPRTAKRHMTRKHSLGSLSWECPV